MNRNTPLPIYDRRNYVDEFVIVDGISRSGKFMLSHVLSAFQDVEFIQFPFLLETLIYLVRLGKLDFEACKIILQTDIDYSTYNMMIGRQLNTRRTDITSVYNSLGSEALLRRAENEDEPGLVREFLEKKRLPLYFCHEGLCNAQTIFRVFPHVKITEILRDPAALILSWFNKGYGKRWGNDPKVINIAFKSAQGNVPWFAVDFAEEYASAGEMERVVLCIESIMRMAREEYLSLTPEQKSRILCLSFEDFVSKPERDLKRLEKFLGKPRHPAISKILERERVPRPSPDPKNEEAMRTICERIPEHRRKSLELLRHEYRDFWVPLSR